MADPFSLSAITAGIGGLLTTVQFGLQLKDVSEQNKIYLGLLMRVHKNLVETMKERNAKIEILKQQFPTKLIWIDEAIVDTTKSLEETSRCIEQPQRLRRRRKQESEEIQEMGVSIEHRLRWVLADYQKFVSRQSVLETYHATLLAVLSFLHGLNLMTISPNPASLTPLPLQQPQRSEKDNWERIDDLKYLRKRRTPSRSRIGEFQPQPPTVVNAYFQLSTGHPTSDSVPPSQPSVGLSVSAEGLTSPILPNSPPPPPYSPPRTGIMPVPANKSTHDATQEQYGMRFSPSSSASQVTKQDYWAPDLEPGVSIKRDISTGFEDHRVSIFSLMSEKADCMDLSLTVTPSLTQSTGTSMLETQVHTGQCWDAPEVVPDVGAPFTHSFAVPQPVTSRWPYVPGADLPEVVPEDLQRSITDAKRKAVRRWH